MTVPYRRISWAPDVLERAGLTVVRYPGWDGRGLSESQMFDPDAVVWHHDASPRGDSPGVPGFMVRNFAAGAAQFWVDRRGVWTIIASGRAPHAGVVLPGKPDNYTSIGVETDHTTGEPWPDAQLMSLRVGTAALLRQLREPAASLHFHKTICDPPGRKVDPAGLNLDDERHQVARLLKPKPPTPPPIDPKDLLEMKLTDTITIPADYASNPAGKPQKVTVETALRRMYDWTYRAAYPPAEAKPGQ